MGQACSWLYYLAVGVPMGVPRMVLPSQTLPALRLCCVDAAHMQCPVSRAKPYVSETWGQIDIWEALSS